MSYEGFSNYLCKNGHLEAVDCWDDSEFCSVCNAEYVWVQNVDQTNGIDPDEPNTFPRELEIDHYEDIPHEDHYGNKYFSRRPCYKIPTGDPGYRIK